jgi:hypothetical protein
MSSQSVRRGKLMTWKVPQLTIKNWARLAANVPKEEAVDCVVNSLHLLGVLKNRAFSEAIATKVNKNQTGIYEHQIINLIYEYLNRKEGVYNVENKTTAGIYPGDIRELRNGEYTFAVLRSKKMGHAVIIYKHNNRVYVYDPQQEKECSETELYDWIKSGNYIQIDFLYYEKIARFRSKTKTNTKTKSKSNTQKKQRVSFDKNIAVFAPGLKTNTKKQKKKSKPARTNKVSTDSLIEQLQRLKID